MSRTTVEHELKLIRQRLDSIEDVLAEEMSSEDKADLKEGLREHRRGKSILFESARKS